MSRMDATPFVPKSGDLEKLRHALQDCRGCPLYEHATQGVLGEGPVRAELMLVGEQPGDQEDLQGRPFVGPAGKLLDRALDAAGIDRAQVYVTNAVKHFKFEQRGKRRIHKKPSTGETNACHPWLDAERDRVHPRVIVCLGATALLELEMLDGVRHVDLRAIDSRRFERAIEELAGWTHERPALQIFLIARLLANQHQRRARRAFTEYALRRMFVKRAASTLIHRLAKRVEIA